jgi:hypothetical protein
MTRHITNLAFGVPTLHAPGLFNYFGPIRLSRALRNNYKIVRLKYFFLAENRAENGSWSAGTAVFVTFL